MALDAVEGETLCPRCKRDLRHSDELITCKMCGDQYPIREELRPDAS